ncbi:MAG: PQQ-binding-like beta-propeller repeat protein [Acidobacteria bacterium]|nr:PQQ-binding-like beta-propeller repeat protein [Acidobacteriota bacterium]
MRNIWLVIVCVAFGALTPAAFAQLKNFAPVTDKMLLNPSPDDWIMPSRTYDWQRYSPLNQVNRQNVGQLRMAWSRGMGPGVHENIPLVYHGVMYVPIPGGTGMQALDATNGDLLWEYRRKLPDDLNKFIGNIGRARALAIYGDMLYYTAADGYVVALDAQTGQLRWETKVQDYHTRTQHTAGPIAVKGKIISGRSCPSAVTTRIGCFIAAHDAKTGQELWKFFTTAAPGEPGGDTWGTVPVEERMASSWGLPGSYDPVRNVMYWGVGNPRPHTRMKRHHGNIDDVGRESPADLYSNSTIALDPDTGKLVWYYQHVPGDDWDVDHPYERILIRSAVNPDSKAVKWIKPGVNRTQPRDMVLTMGKPGGLFVLDRDKGDFLWATPFPADVPEFVLSKIDVETGKTYLNWEQVLKKDGDKKLVCSVDMRYYGPLAYSPKTNSLYVGFQDSCNEKTAENASPEGDSAKLVIRPGSDPSAFGGLAKINMATGQVQRLFKGPIGSEGAVLATAGDLVFWGDMDRRFRAFDADTGKVLWENIVSGMVQNSTITYAVNGKQYVAILTGDGGPANGSLGVVPSVKPARGHNTIFVYALP